jgi:hypothetical protein
MGFTTIPFGTAFILSGSGSDANGDSLTYMGTDGLRHN